MDSGESKRDLRKTNALLGRSFLNSRFSAIIPAFRTYPVIQYRTSAVGTNRGRWNYRFVVSSSLVTPSGGDFVFWVWHNYSILNINFTIKINHYFSVSTRLPNGDPCLSFHSVLPVFG